MRGFVMLVCVCRILAAAVPAAAQVRINEVCTDPQSDWSGGGWQADGGGSVTGSDEYVELYNPGADTVDLQGWMIECTDSRRDTQLIDSVLIKTGAGGGTRIAPGGYAVLGNIRGDMTNSVRVSLYDTAGTLIDQVALGAFDDGNAADNALDGNSDTTGTATGRDWFHTDTDIDSSDFLKVFASPGRKNTYRTTGVLTVDTSLYTGFGAVLAALLRDRDRDVSPETDACTAAVRSRTAHDSTAIVLSETGAHTAVFNASLGFAPAAGGTGSIGVYPDGDTVDITYVDPVYGDTVSVSVRWQPPVETGRVVVHEVMANAYGSESDNEWIELYNADADTVRLRGWTLAVGGAAVPLPDTLMLPPAAYCVVARQVLDTDGDEDSFERLWGNGDDIWGNTAAELYAVVQCGFGTLINGGASVVLSGGAGYADTVAWLTDAGNGVSWERITVPGTELLACTDPAGGTPGSRNSVTPYARDCAPVPGSVRMVLQDSTYCELSARVANCGYEPAAAIVEFVSGGAVVGAGTTGTITPGDAADVAVAWDTVASGAYTVRIVLSPDDRTANDTLDTVIELEGILVSDVVINELMFDPGEDGVEWIELYNRSHVPLNLYGWSCGDAGDGSPFDSVVITARGFVIVTADRQRFLEQYPAVACPVAEPGSWDPLNNTGDDAVIRDRYGRITASVSYRSVWMGDAEGQDGVSLERIDAAAPSGDADNWWACTAAGKATPGAVNSVSAASGAGDVRIHAVPDPFSPDGDGYDDETVIEIRVPSRSYVTAELYDIRGRLLKTFCTDTPCAGTYSVTWNGDGDDGARLDLGIYLLYLEVRDAADGRMTRRKATVVSARRMN